VRAKLLAAFSASALIALGASSTAGAVTIGQTSAANFNCAPNLDVTTQSVSSGSDYVVPSTGGILNWTLTSWSHEANGTPGSLTMKVWHHVSGLTYQAVSHDGPRTLTVNSLNTFNTQMPVKAGDILGLHTTEGSLGCVFTTANAGDVPPFFNGDLQDGQSATFNNGSPGFRQNISAVVTPSNTFTVGATTKNKKKGTATLTIADLPNPGDLTASGSGVKAASTATISKAVLPGTATLLIKAKGKKKKTLNAKGNVKLKVAVTYTPTGGDASTKSVKVKLKKKL
jgi:hypothetical protein